MAADGGCYDDSDVGVWLLLCCEEFWHEELAEEGVADVVDTLKKMVSENRSHSQKWLDDLPNVFSYPSFVKPGAVPLIPAFRYN